MTTPPTIGKGDTFVDMPGCTHLQPKYVHQVRAVDGAGGDIGICPGIWRRARRSKEAKKNLSSIEIRTRDPSESNVLVDLRIMLVW